MCTHAKQLHFNNIHTPTLQPGVQGCHSRLYSTWCSDKLSCGCQLLYVTIDNITTCHYMYPQSTYNHSMISSCSKFLKSLTQENFQSMSLHCFLQITHPTTQWSPQLQYCQLSTNAFGVNERRGNACTLQAAYVGRGGCVTELMLLSPMCVHTGCVAAAAQLLPALSTYMFPFENDQ